MPSPLGHALGGVAVGWALAPAFTAGPEPSLRRLVRGAAWFAVLGMLPDADLLFGHHRGPSHSLGAALIAGLAAAAVSRQGRMGLASGCAYASHTLLDWLGSDSSVPVGIMALWPASRTYFQSSLQLFDSVWRRNETPDFWTHNIQAVARELVILLPAAWLALRVQWRRSIRAESVGTVQQEKEGRGA